MIVPKQEILALTGESDSFDLDFAHRGVEEEVKSYIGWDPESTTYNNKLIDGTGGDTLWLPGKNITAIGLVSTSKQQAIKIKNTTANANSYARVIYSSNAASSLGLNRAGASETDIAFSTYTTLTDIVSQIDATGSGWSADIYDSDYDSFPSTVLLEEDNVYCGTWDGSDPGWSDLYMPGEPVTGYTLERTEGGLYRSGEWPNADKSVIATFTAGWSTANMPADLKRAVATLVKYFYNRHQQATTGVKSYSLGHLRVEYDAGSEGASSIPIEVLDVLETKYRIQSAI
jgi:hypothetical protein